MSADPKRYRRAIMATCCVPWREDFTFDAGLFRWQVQHLIEAGIRDLYVFGTAGEGHAVTDRQFDEIVGEFLAATDRPGVQSLIGIISLSLPTVVERIERAAAAGARRFQISLPSWGALNDAELDAFFAETCGRFAPVEFMHYNLARSRRVLTPVEYARLAERHPNFVATKNSSSDAAFLADLLREAPQLQHFITEPGFATAAMSGECGLLLSVASIQPALALRYLAAGAARDEATLRALQKEFGEVIADLLRCVGGAAHMDGAFDKMFCRVADPRFPLRLLPPYAAAPEGAFAAFLQTLQTRCPHWLAK
jgi:dihydrodipicolinate synthase/N-acetylneuraminate lyase